MAAIEFHDSYLLAVDQTQGTLDLNAWVYPEDSISEEPEGSYRRVRMTLLELTMDCDLGELPFDIYRGTLFVDGVELVDRFEFRRPLLLPSRTEGRIQLTFQCREDAREVTFRGVGLSADVAT